MRRAALLVGAVLTLGFSPQAEAKGTTTVHACGPEDCVRIGDVPLAGQIVTVAEVVEAPIRAPYYRIDVTQDAGRETQTFSDLFVPSSGLVASNLGSARRLLWYQPAGRSTEELRVAVRGLTPFDAPSAWPVSVDTPLQAPAPGGRGWRAYALLAGLGALTLAAFALAARRIRIRHPRTA